MALSDLPRRVRSAFDALRGDSVPAASARSMGSPIRAESLVPRTPMPTRRRLRSHYRAAATSRTLSDWRPTLNSPDDIVRAEMRELRGRARELDRSDPLVGMYGDQIISNVLGAEGMEHKAQVLIPGTDQLDERVNKTIDAVWDEYWSGVVTADGQMNGDMFERTQLRNVPVDGEAFTRCLIGPDFRHGIAFQSVDPDLVDDYYNVRGQPGLNEIRMGVEIDNLGRRIRYHVKDEPYLPGSRGRGRYTIEANDLRHHFWAMRGNQTRGITWFTRSMLLLNHSERWLEAAVVGARVGANQGGTIEWKDESLAPAPTESGGSGSETEGQAGGGSSATGGTGVDPATSPELEMEPGMFLELAPGQTMQEFKPNYPNGDTPEFLKAVDKRTAVGMGIMHWQLTGDLEATSWSSMRGGEVSMRDLWRIKQGWWRWSYRSWFYERWLEASILAGTLKLPSMTWQDYRRVKFSPKGWDSVDQQKEQDANEKKLKLRITSRTRICAEKNIDFKDIVKELEAEEKLLKAAGIVSEPAPVTAATPPPAKPDDEDGDNDAGNGNGNGNGTKKRALTNRIAAAVR